MFFCHLMTIYISNPHDSHSQCQYACSNKLFYFAPSSSPSSYSYRKCTHPIHIVHSLYANFCYFFRNGKDATSNGGNAISFAMPTEMEEVVTYLILVKHSLKHFKWSTLLSIPTISYIHCEQWHWLTFLFSRLAWFVIYRQIFPFSCCTSYLLCKLFVSAGAPRYSFYALPGRVFRNALAHMDGTICVLAEMVFA